MYKIMNNKQKEWHCQQTYSTSPLQYPPPSYHYAIISEVEKQPFMDFQKKTRKQGESVKKE
jgi:hypothetical protein